MLYVCVSRNSMLYVCVSRDFMDAMCVCVSRNSIIYVCVSRDSMLHVHVLSLLQYTCTCEFHASVTMVTS